MNSKELIILTIAILLTGCTKTLVLDLKNSDNETYALRYSVTKDKNIPEKIGIGSIKNNGYILNKKEDFPADSEVTLQALRGDSLVIWQSPVYTMNQDRKDSINIYKNGSGFIEYDPASALKVLESTEQEFKKIVPELNKFQTEDNAFNAGLGSFIARKRNTNDPWETIINAGAYDGVKDANWRLINAGAGELTIEKTITMNKNLTSRVDGGFTIFKALAGYTDSDFYDYSVKINLLPLKLNDTTFTVMRKMQTNKIYKQYLDILNKYIKDTTYEVRFLNKVWIIKDFTTGYKKYNKIESDGGIKAGSFVDGNVAYTSTNEFHNVSIFKNIVGSFEWEPVNKMLDDDVDDAQVMKTNSIVNNPSSQNTSSKSGGL